MGSVYNGSLLVSHMNAENLLFMYLGKMPTSMTELLIQFHRLSALLYSFLLTTV